MDLITFKKYSGFRINGTVPMGMPGVTHVERAAWLTAQVESGGKFGSVISYDGTCITASLHQAIAVYPAEIDDGDLTDDQGPLWKVLNRIRMVAPQLPIFYELEAGLWKLGPDGVLRYANGKLVSGKELRSEFNGSEDGVTPQTGIDRDRSEYWVKIFHDTFSYEPTFACQVQLGEEHIVKRAQRTPMRFLSGYSGRKLLANKTIQEIVYYYTPITAVVPGVKLADGTAFSMAMDLALSMFWSNTVNAPGQALKMLCKAYQKASFPLDETTGGSLIVDLARRIIGLLGNTTYGRWDDDIPNGRYQRTRTIAMNSGLWPQELFEGTNAIMPKNLLG